MPAITPTKKNISINHGLVPNQLSKINPIIVPTATAETNSVLILNATPIPEEDSSSSMGAAFKMSTELVSAVAVGTIIGFILDNWFGTKPWLILIFFFVGVIAGIMNVIKSARKMQKK